MPKRSSGNPKASKNKKAKPELVDLPFGFVERFAALDELARRNRLTSDGKMKLKSLQDKYDSVQACRRRKGMELLPESEVLVNKYLLQKYFNSDEIAEPSDPYPFPWSDDEPLPPLPKELEKASDESTDSKEERNAEPSIADARSTIKQTVLSAEPVLYKSSDSTSKDDKLLSEFYQSLV